MLLANDANAARCKAIVGNLHRLGITNTVVCNEDGRKLPGVMKGFDRVLLDAPCSGMVKFTYYRVQCTGYTVHGTGYTKQQGCSELDITQGATAKLTFPRCVSGFK